MCDRLYFTFLNRQSKVHSAFQLIRNKIIKQFRVEYSLRPVKTAFHGELVSNNEIFISYDRQVAHTGITEFFLFSLYYFNRSKGQYNEPAFRCFAVTLLYSVAVTELLMKPETHCTSKKNLTRTDENKCHTHKKQFQCAHSSNLHNKII